ncbi:MAG TPA: GvpL/GvpF family gas vesicle protein [Nocardioidaceae bacterium]|nr:GvpL/GvpF family gas vesicle protein [Nocardioidaceae bacterium]
MSPVAAEADADPAESMQGTGLGCYVYGVVAADAVIPKSLSGIDGRPVRLVRHGEVAAVVADISADRPPGRRKDLVAHGSVLDTLCTSCTVVPVRFGSLLADDHSVVEDFLALHEDRFAAYLTELADRSQYNLRAIYHQNLALEEIVRADPKIAQLRRQTRDLPSPQGHGVRIRLGELVAHALDAKRSEDTDILLESIVPFTASHAVRPLRDVDDAADLAFLVDDDRAAEFEQQLEDLAEAVHERMRLRLVGPVAPYDFVED